MPRHTASFDYPKRVHFNCTKCGRCCGDTNTRVRHILILEREAEQVSEITSKPIEEFATNIEGNEPYVYEMKKTKSEGRCLFLKQNTCTIYASRPLICRFYPFQLRAVKNRIYRFSCTEECPGMNRGKQLGKNYFENLFQQAYGQLGEKMVKED